MRSAFVRKCFVASHCRLLCQFIGERGAHTIRRITHGTAAAQRNSMGFPRLFAAVDSRMKYSLVLCARAAGEPSICIHARKTYMAVSCRCILRFGSCECSASIFIHRKFYISIDGTNFTHRNQIYQFILIVVPDLVADSRRFSQAIDSLVVRCSCTLIERSIASPLSIVRRNIL